MPGRIRTLKPEWLDDQRMSRASDSARVMSIALILLADDYGNGRCDPDAIASRVWPSREMSLEGILRHSRKSQESLLELTELRFSGLYVVDGQTYFTIRNWSKHQKVNHPSKPLVPGPPEGFWEQSQETLKRVSRDILRVSRESQESLLPDHDHDQRPTTTKLPGSQGEQPASNPELVTSHSGDEQSPAHSLPSEPFRLTSSEPLGPTQPPEDQPESKDAPERQPGGKKRNSASKPVSGTDSIDQSSGTHQLKLHYVEQFELLRGSKFEIPKNQWGRAQKAFGTLVETYGLETAKRIVTSALSSRFCLKVAPWDILANAANHIGSAQPQATNQPRIENRPPPPDGRAGWVWETSAQKPYWNYSTVKEREASEKRETGNVAGC